MPEYIRTANIEMKHHQLEEVRKPRNKYNYSEAMLMTILPHVKTHTVHINKKKYCTIHIFILTTTLRKWQLVLVMVIAILNAVYDLPIYI